MKVFMTGATGFIGAHTAMALLDAGHDVRLLARDENKARQYFSPRGYELKDIVVADMCDKAAISAAIQGCDAVFHAAAIVSLDISQAQTLYEQNLAGMKAVIDSAVESGIGNILFVSSLAALFSADIECIDEHSPLGNPKDAYAKSKRDCDEYVRNLQAAGRSIQISYPSGVFGPDDPGLSESNKALTTFVRAMVPNTTSGIQCVDVRDVASAHLYLLENPPQENIDQARYMLAGHYYSWPEFHALLERVTGNKIANPSIPAPVFRAMGAIGDFLKKFYPFDFVITAESMAIVTRWKVADNRKIERESGLIFRPGEETFADAIAWLVEAKTLGVKYAGKVVV